jgi:hypothetical protein
MGLFIRSECRFGHYIYHAAIWRIVRPLTSLSTAPRDSPYIAHAPMSRRKTRARHINGRTMAAVAPASAAIPHLITTTWLFSASTIYAAVLAVSMIIAPKWHRTQQIMRSPLCLMPIALVYGILLAWSWQPDTFSLILPGSFAEGVKGGWNPQFFPQLAGIVALFSRAPTAASLWVHLLAINLFAARAVFFDGLQHSVLTMHSILLCMVLGPLGLVSHGVTKWLCLMASSRREQQGFES